MGKKSCLHRLAVDGEKGWEMFEEYRWFSTAYTAQLIYLVLPRLTKHSSLDTRNHISRVTAKPAVEKAKVADRIEASLIHNNTCHRCKREKSRAR